MPVFWCHHPHGLGSMPDGHLSRHGAVSHKGRHHVFILEALLWSLAEACVAKWLLPGHSVLQASMHSAPGPATQSHETVLTTGSSSLFLQMTPGPLGGEAGSLLRCGPFPEAQPSCSQENHLLQEPWVSGPACFWQEESLAVGVRGRQWQAPAAPWLRTA